MNLRAPLFLTGLAMFLVPGRNIWPCGISTHVELATRAGYFFDAPSYPDYGYYVASYPEAIQGGASFPDWGYALPDYGDAAEEAHWDPFLQAAADYVYRTYPPPWDQETERLAVFLFAVSAHSISDIRWHGLGAAEGMIDVMAAQDHQGDWSAAHDTADTGGDMVAAYELDQSYMTAPWYVPVDDMLNVYHEMGYDDVTAQALISGNFLIFLGGQAERLAGQLLFPKAAEASPVLVEQYQDYFVGGLDDMAIQSSWKWQEMIQWMENGTAGARRSITGIYDHDQRPLESVRRGLQLFHSHQLDVVIEKTPRGVLFRLERPLPKNVPAKVAKAQRIQEKADSDGKGGSLRLRSVRRSERADDWSVVSTLVSTNPYAHLGTSLNSADLNRDGFDDLVIGAPGYGSPGLPQCGRVYVLYGAADAPTGTIDPDTSSNVQRLDGHELYGRFGWASAVLDFNADGWLDLVIASPTAGSESLAYHGKIEVYFGSSSSPFSSSLEISASADYTNLGYVLASGDLNRDGYDDLLIGNTFARAGGTQRGQVAAFLSGKARASGQVIALESADWLQNGQVDYDWYGSSILVVNQEGMDPLLLIGAPTVNQEELQSVGALYGYQVNAATAGMTVEERFILVGSAEFDQLGGAIDYGPVLDGDDALLAIALPTASDGAFVHTGDISLVRLEDLLGTLSIDDAPLYCTLQGSQDFSRLGWQVKVGPHEDLAARGLWASSPWRITTAGAEAGVLYHWRPDDLHPATIDRAEDAAGESFVGDQTAARLGSSFVFADLDGDARYEVIIASRQASEGERTAGSVSIWQSISY